MRIVFDLDGTLADIGHRLHHIQTDKPDWDAFFADCHKDTPINPALTMLRILIANEGTNVEIWSGRSMGENEEIYNTTRNWLRSKVLGIMGSSEELPHLLMRAHGDHRPDVELKREWLRALRSLGLDVDLVFEDRSSVVAMWREEGVPCYQVAAGDF